MTKLVQTTDDYKGDNLEIHYFHDSLIEQSAREVYNDNGLLSSAFEKQQYEILKLEAKSTKKGLKFNFNASIGKKWNPKIKKIKLIIHNMNWQPNNIKVAGKKIKSFTNKNQITIPVLWNPKKKITIKLTHN